ASVVLTWSLARQVQSVVLPCGSSCWITQSTMGWPLYVTFWLTGDEITHLLPVADSSSSSCGSVGGTGAKRVETLPVSSCIRFQPIVASPPTPAPLKGIQASVG